MLSGGNRALRIAWTLCTVQHRLGGCESMAVVVDLIVRTGYLGVGVQGVMHDVIPTNPFKSQDEVQSRPAITLEILLATHIQVWL